MHTEPAFPHGFNVRSMILLVDVEDENGVKRPAMLELPNFATTDSWDQRIDTIYEDQTWILDRDLNGVSYSEEQLIGFEVHLSGRALPTSQGTGRLRFLDVEELPAGMEYPGE